MAELTPQRKTAYWLMGIVAVMVSLSFIAVPFYSWFCKKTGFGGTTSVATHAPAHPLAQEVTVRFDASIDRGMPWEFKTEQTKMTLHIGETGLAFFQATNTSDHPVAGQASYNVTPDSAGGYFTKIACFCFTAQILQPGQTVQMPVTFFVDPAIVQDPEGKFVKEITLSYTFHEIPLDVAQAALAGDTSKPVN
ncbi:cytochrome c oxidase assembly protein [bacterium]|nr:cytochrome c oxidase assembly protein [bacterium]